MILSLDNVLETLSKLDSVNDKYNYICNNYKNMTSYTIIKVMSSLPNIYRLKFYLSYFRYNSCNIDYLKKLLTDKQKAYFLKDFNEEEKALILLYTLDKNVLKDNIHTIKNTKEYLMLLARTDDSLLIKEEFKKMNSLIKKYKLINFVKNVSIKKELISLLDDKEISDFLLSNYTEIKDDTTVEKLVNQTKINENITIGVELECCNKDIQKYRKLKNLYKNYDIKEDPSVRSGFEITSPILHYTLSDMSSLNEVCELLKKCNFYTDETCGGHIHIGSDYLTSNNELLMLLYLYIYTEDIIYYITDKEGSVKRGSAPFFAGKSKDELVTFINNKTLDYKDSSRNKGLNLKNIGTSSKNTIEFRMPNGEIKFTELLANIKLFARLIEVSHDLVNMSESNETYIKALSLYRINDESEKLNILLEILFPNKEDRLIYLRRYKANKILNEELTKEENTLVKRIV